MDTITILRYGTPVRLEFVDRYGYCGREHHPDESDVGFLGVVVGNFVEGPTGVRANVLGGTEVTYDDENEAVGVCYVVRGPDGRVLELMDHEIEALS